jgi:hypothetical protein
MTLTKGNIQHRRKKERNRQTRKMSCKKLGVFLKPKSTGDDLVSGWWLNF